MTGRLVDLSHEIVSGEPTYPGLPVPVVVRLEGTNVELGKEILAKSGLPLITADGMWDAAQKVVEAAKRRDHPERSEGSDAAKGRA